MTYEITEIKDIRRKLSITQSELAKRSGVSQSLIAKIESNRLDPTYTNVKKIFSALDLLTHKKETKAEEIMNKKIVSVGPEDLLRDVIKFYPVVLITGGGKLCGLITKSDILRNIGR